MLPHHWEHRYAAAATAFFSRAMGSYDERVVINVTVGMYGPAEQSREAQELVLEWNGVSLNLHLTGESTGVHADDVGDGREVAVGGDYAADAVSLHYRAV